MNHVSVDAAGSLYLALRIRKSLEPYIRETQGSATSALVKLEVAP